MDSSEKKQPRAATCKQDLYRLSAYIAAVMANLHRLELLDLLAQDPRYAFENTHTAIQLARAALDKGYAVNLFAPVDGVHNFSRDQNPKGLPNAGKEFAELIERDLHVELCGMCLNFRGIGTNDFMPGAEPSTMKWLFGMMKPSDAFITIGS